MGAAFVGAIKFPDWHLTTRGEKKSMFPVSNDDVIANYAHRYSISEEAVRVLLSSLRKSGGAMAQFNHPELGGMGQWSGGMTMIGDMFNDQLRGKVGALAADLAQYVRANPAAPAAEVSYRAPVRTSIDWWPAELGPPSSTGSQNNLRYAIFPSTRRLAIEDNGDLTIYDTADHVIRRISQSQMDASTLTLESQLGLVPVTDLRRI